MKKKIENNNYVNIKAVVRIMAAVIIHSANAYDSCNSNQPCHLLLNLRHLQL